MKRIMSMLLAVMFLSVSTNAHADYKTKEDGATIMFVTVLGALAGMIPSNIVFGGGEPASSAFIMAVTTLTAYSQLPHVRRNFRENKAIEEFGITELTAKSMSDEDLLDVIRDDVPGKITGRGNNAFLDAGMLPRLGG